MELPVEISPQYLTDEQGRRTSVLLSIEDFEALLGVCDEGDLKADPNGARDNGRAPIWEVAGDIAAKVPPEEWNRLPEDLAKNLEDYLRLKQKAV